MANMKDQRPIVSMPRPASTNEPCANRIISRARALAERVAPRRSDSAVARDALSAPNRPVLVRRWPVPQHWVLAKLFEAQRRRSLERRVDDLRAAPVRVDLLIHVTAERPANRATDHAQELFIRHG